MAAVQSWMNDSFHVAAAAAAGGGGGIADVPIDQSGVANDEA